MGNNYKSGDVFPPYGGSNRSEQVAAKAIADIFNELAERISALEESATHAVETNGSSIADAVAQAAPTPAKTTPAKATPKK